MCAETIVIGTIGALETVTVVFKNTANGRIDTEEVMSDYYGAFEVTWPNRVPNLSYEVYLLNGETFEVEGETDPVTCVTVAFEIMNDYAPTTYTLTAA